MQLQSQMWRHTYCTSGFHLEHLLYSFLFINIFYFIFRVCHKSHTFHLISHTRPLFFHRFSFDFREGHHILDFIFLYHECNFLPRWQHLLFFSFSILIFFLVTFFFFQTWFTPSVNCKTTTTTANLMRIKWYFGEFIGKRKSKGTEIWSVFA